VGVEGGGGRLREMVVGGQGWWQVVEGSSGSREMAAGQGRWWWVEGDGGRWLRVVASG